MSYVSMPGTGTTRINTPDSVGLSLLGDMDIRGLFTLTDWTPGTTQTVLSHFLATGNQRSWLLRVGTTGVLSFLWSLDGSATLITVNSTSATGFTDGTAHWLRLTHDVDNGLVGNNVAFYTSNDPITTDPSAVTWVQLGTTVTTALTTSHHNSTAPIAIGAHDAGATGRMVGKAYYAELRSSIGGTIVGNPDFRTATQTTDGGLTFVDSTPNTWSLQTAAVWVPTPATPATPAATAVSSTQIDVSWANVASETGFRVERSLNGTSGWTNVSGSLPADTLSYSDTGLTASTQYFYRVFSFDAEGNGPASSVVNATTQATPAAPGTSRKVIRSPRYGTTRKVTA